MMRNQMECLEEKLDNYMNTIIGLRPKIIEYVSSCYLYAV